jgi:hypothetical protein
MFLLMPDRICICAGAFDRRSEKQTSCTLQRKISREGKEPAKEMANETQQKEAASHAMVASWLRVATCRSATMNLRYVGLPVGLVEARFVVFRA